MYKNVTK